MSFKFQERKFCCGPMLFTWTPSPFILPITNLNFETSLLKCKFFAPYFLHFSSHYLSNPTLPT